MFSNAKYPTFIQISSYRMYHSSVTLPGNEAPPRLISPPHPLDLLPPTIDDIIIVSLRVSLRHLVLHRDELVQLHVEDLDEVGGQVLGLDLGEAGFFKSLSVFGDG